jgi:hypothetical protein
MDGRYGYNAFIAWLGLRPVRMIVRAANEEQARQLASDPARHLPHAEIITYVECLEP